MVAALYVTFFMRTPGQPRGGEAARAFRVAGEDEETPLAGKDKQPEKRSKEEVERAKAEAKEELEKYKKEGQVFLDSHRSLFTSFGQDISLRYKMSDGFYIKLEEGEVNLDTKWFKDKGFSRQQILWAVLHEISHFRDLADDPKGMMANFEYIHRQAQSTGAVMMKKWEDKYGASHPEFIEHLKQRRPVGKPGSGKTLNQIESNAYQIHHTFGNVFDDVFVNSTVARRAPAFARGAGGGKEIERLYKEKLFAPNDYTQHPRHLQFIYALLRGEMIPGEELTLAEDVQQALEQPTMYLGAKHTPRQIVEKFIKPGRNNKTKASERYFVLKRTLEPVFMGLVMKDLDDWDPQLPPEPKPGDSHDGDGEGEGGGQGGGNPFAASYKEFAENSPDQMSEEEVGKWFEKQMDDQAKAAEKAKRAETYSKKTPAEKATDAKAELDKRWAEKNNVSLESLQEFRKVEAEVEPYLNELAELWEKIIYGSGKDSQRRIEGHFKTGTDLDLQEVVNAWPSIEQGKMEDVRVMKRDIRREVLVASPELIRVRVLADLSGSMDGEKKAVLTRCIVLLLASLREFNTKLNLTRAQTKSQLSVDTEAWGFGAHAVKMKPFRSEAAEDEQVEIVNIFEKLKTSLGSTADDKVLDAVADSLTPEDKERMQAGKIMDIVFEITDGGANDPNLSRAAADRLLGEGVIARSFQIGEVSENETVAFNHVWNDGREDGLGETLGSDIANLTPAVVSALKKYLSGIRL